MSIFIRSVADGSHRPGCLIIELFNQAWPAVIRIRIISISQAANNYSIAWPGFQSSLSLRILELVRQHFCGCLFNSIRPGIQDKPEKSCKRHKQLLQTFCQKSHYFEDILSHYPILLNEDGGRIKYRGWITVSTSVFSMG